MNKKIRDKFDSWDLKSLFLTIISFSICLFLIYYLSDIRERFRQSDKEEYKGRTIGEILSIEPVERIRQTRTKGTEIFTDSYKIVYSYNVGGQTFQKTNVIQLTRQNEKLIKGIIDRSETDTFLVNFDENDPNNSILTGKN